MWLKIVIVVLFLGVLISLSSALVFLLNDMGSKSKRTLYALGIRITLAGLLLGCIFYGLKTGQLGSSAPWDSGPAITGAAQSPQQLEP
ncbi:MAG: DUF2909 domain-containing protein [Gammaproteobacteria bacterium]|uniref:DUF2909 domain-containing protein n=1 Tax=Pseudomaricurvus alcaniphilus TaxID=1166482 RepID=UPI00140AD32E|nr:DUF2909 domain-containing protein [Pseudomaricurvus alcaniphilus]MBR9912617.1 DUF2909 domain-containing protein [Gammaproteobacteria bacterium]NHN38800.1 DUF2909 domain-containing protein [Pseudomaricurvus alcaniphilus]